MVLECIQGACVTHVTHGGDRGFSRRLRQPRMMKRSITSAASASALPQTTWEVLLQKKVRTELGIQQPRLCATTPMQCTRSECIGACFVSVDTPILVTG